MKHLSRQETMGHVNQVVRKPKQKTFLHQMQQFEKEVEKEFQERSKSTEVVIQEVQLNPKYKDYIFPNLSLQFFVCNYFLCIIFIPY